MSKLIMSANSCWTEATACANELCSALEGDLEHANQQQRAEAASAGTMGGVTFASAIGVDEHFAATLRSFFDDEIKPYLVQHGGRGRVLADKERTSAMFQQFRILCPQDFWPRLNDLENICEEKRELDRQRVLHRVLHGWLLVHIPASYALLALGCSSRCNSTEVLTCATRQNRQEPCASESTCSTSPACMGSGGGGLCSP